MQWEWLQQSNSGHLPLLQGPLLSPVVLGRGQGLRSTWTLEMACETCCASRGRNSITVTWSLLRVLPSLRKK